MNKLLIVGQTPPPYGGQAVMIDYLVNANFTNLKIYHVRMKFSKGMEDMGKLQLRKAFHLLSIIFKIYYYRLFKQVKTLYYPPSGPNSAVYRDIAILYPTRWLFKKTIFHFHASGLSEHLRKNSKFFLQVFKRCFMKPDLSIHLSPSCPQEGKKLFSKRNVIIPNGMPDEVVGEKDNYRTKTFTILFIGLLEETKGEFDILAATKLLKDKGYEISVNIAGQFKREEFKTKFFNTVVELKIEENVNYLGIIRGEQKNKAFQESDCFCFPSYFHSESFPLVLIEAMEYSLPVIASDWRGIPDMIDDNYNGLLIKPKNPEKIAEKIQYLIENQLIRQELGKNGRTRFLKKYEIKAHLSSMEDAINSIF